jgi:hypothetical protein
MRRLHNGYVSSLADRLRAGNLDVSQLELVDATMRIAMSETQQALKRDASLPNAVQHASGDAVPGRTELIERTHRGALTGSRPTASAPPARRPFVEPPPRSLEPSEIDDLLVAIADLRSGDPARIVSSLAHRHPLPRVLIGFAIPLLAEDDVADAAAAALRAIAPANTGALLDAVLQSRTPLAVRRKLCDLLGHLPTQRSVDGLVLLLSDLDFELRFRAATSLLEIRRSASQLVIPREPLFDAALEEALASRRSWRAAQAMGDRLSNTRASESAQGRRVVQGVTFIFTLLLSVLEREPLQLAIRALSMSTGGDRGTGLEYLENVLHAQLLQALRPLLEDHALALGHVQSRDDILAELVDDAKRRPMDLASLRRQIDARGRRTV